MRFVTFETVSGQGSAGVLNDAGDRVLDLSHPACKPLLHGCQPSLLAMVERGLDAFVQRIGAAEGIDPAAHRPLSTVKLLAPLRPGKVIGAAYNFTDALDQRQMPHPSEPVTFFRSACTVVGPDDAVCIPPDVGYVTYEAELAVVIGSRCLRVSAADAMQHVAGYIAHNDISASDLTKADGSFVRGKNMLCSAPLGPWLLSADALPDPHAVGIRLSIDGRPLQNGSTATMLHRIPELIAHISARMPLEPGDVIATGTPAGVAGTHHPPAWLKSGMTVTVEVDGLGRLVSPVVAGEPFLTD